MAKQLTKNDVRELFMDVINVDLKAAVDPITTGPSISVQARRAFAVTRKLRIFAATPSGSGGK